VTDTFQCGLHNFSTTDITKWDEHCAETDHEYDLHINCANGCGTKLHIKPNQKVSKESNRIPRGYVCSDCKDLVQTVPEITEAGES
jgi:DNA-directed RNA polymerase subunit RPC12/RpoP